MHTITPTDSIPCREAHNVMHCMYHLYTAPVGSCSHTNIGPYLPCCTSSPIQMMHMMMFCCVCMQMTATGVCGSHHGVIIAHPPPSTISSSLNQLTHAIVPPPQVTITSTPDVVQTAQCETPSSLQSIRVGSDATCHPVGRSGIPSGANSQSQPVANRKSDQPQPCKRALLADSTQRKAHASPSIQSWSTPRDIHGCARCLGQTDRQVHSGNGKVQFLASSKRPLENLEQNAVKQLC